MSNTILEIFNPSRSGWIIQ